MPSPPSAPIPRDAPPRGPRLFLVAGERSGDAHAAALMRALLERRATIRFAGLGGPLMSAASNGAVEDWCDAAAVVGLWDVLRNYGFFRRRLLEMSDEIVRADPDALVLVDYPGFNLRLAASVRRRGFRGAILSYISPQIWAWNPGRARRMTRLVDVVLCLFPFEVAPYRAVGLDAEFVGHPMVDALASLDAPPARDASLVGLFPGSRWREVRRIFPPMLHAARRVLQASPDIRFEIAAVSAEMADAIRQMAGPDLPGTIAHGNAHSLMRRARFGLVASGTATLEAAFLGMPMALVYRVAPLTYEVGRRLIRVPHLGMVNILAGREVVPEFLQHAATGDRLAAEILRALRDPATLDRMTRHYREVLPALGQPGASGRAADAILARIGPAR